MFNYPPTIIWRHRRENLKKCSLRGLESRLDMRFVTYPAPLPDVTGYVVLALEAPILTSQEKEKGVLLIDATWRYAVTMLNEVHKLPGLVYRSLPPVAKTAYPRKQTECPEPERGLASLEALFLTYKLLGRDPTGLLDKYYWRNVFLEINEIQEDPTHF